METSSISALSRQTFQEISNMTEISRSSKALTLEKIGGILVAFIAGLRHWCWASDDFLASSARKPNKVECWVEFLITVRLPKLSSLSERRV
jgi:hypothetical protein